MRQARRDKVNTKPRHERIPVDLAVTLTAVLDTMEAQIIDLSENGAGIVDASMPKGAQFQIEYRGQIVYAKVIWSEIDRMGVHFPFGLGDGPLYDALLMASDGVTATLLGAMATATPEPRPQILIRRSAQPFGRRAV